MQVVKLVKPSIRTVRLLLVAAGCAVAWHSTGLAGGQTLAQKLAGCDQNHPLYLAPGTYSTQAPLTVPAGCRLSGDAFYALVETPNTLIIADNSTGAFNSGAVLTLDENSILEHIGVYGDNVAGHADAILVAGKFATLNWVIARNANNGVNCQAQGVQIRNSILGANKARGYIDQGSCYDSTYALSNFFGNAGDGALFGSSKQTIIGDIFEENSAAGATLFAGLNARQTIVGAQFMHNGLVGLNINAYQQPTSDISVTGSHFEANGALQQSGWDGHLRLADQITNLIMAGNTYDYAGSPATPNYVFNGAGSNGSPDLINSRIVDMPGNQAIAVYDSAATQTAVQPSVR